MRFSITFKTPDVVDGQRLKEDIALHCAGPDVGPDEDCSYCLEILEEAKKLTNQFIKHGELITVEFDTIARTATVLKAR